MSFTTRWTQEELEEHLRKRGQPAPKAIAKPAAPKRSKHGNVHTIVDNMKFDSKLEARFYKQLVMEWRAGNVMWFERQRPFELEGGVKYVCDFIAVRGNKQKAEVHTFHVYDCKGDPTQESLNKIKQVKARYGLRVELIKDADIMQGITV